MTGTSKAKLNGWLQIIRLPNLFTLPGDPLAGAFLASVVSDNSISLLPLCSLILAIFAVYCFGLMQNDLADYESDRKNRPERPLPGKVISIKEVKAALAVTLVAGMLLAFAAGPAVFVTAALLFMLVSAYNLSFKRDVIKGPVTMGLCRGFSFLAGAAIFIFPSPFIFVIAAAGVTAYIASVTYIAYHEQATFNFGRKADLPLLYFVGTYAVVFMYLIKQVNLVNICAATAVIIGGGIVIYNCQRRLKAGKSSPAVTQKTVGNLIQSLVFLQAALLLLIPQPFAFVMGLVILLVFYPLSFITGRLFAGS